MKSEDRTYYPGRIEAQPYNMEGTSGHIHPENEETGKAEAEENKQSDYSVEEDNHYVG